MTFQPPVTPLGRLCPAYRAAMAEFDRLTKSGDERGAAAAFQRAQELAEVFNQGAKYALENGAVAHAGVVS